MDKIQIIRVKLSNGVIGHFYGVPIVDENSPKDLTVADVQFERPFTVAGITFEESAHEQPAT